MSDHGYTREAVSERLLRTASEVWSAQGAPGGHADPLVRLLFGAMSLELERIGQAIHDSDARVFERVAQYLLPEVMIRAEPAHAVAKFSPTSSMMATRYEELTFEQTIRRKENMNRPETRQFGFSVAGDVMLSGSSLKQKAVGQSLMDLTGSTWRIRAPLTVSLQPHVLYLGFQGAFKESEVVRLFFDWPGHQARARCLAALPQMTAHDAEGRPLYVGVGLPAWKPNDERGDLEMTMSLEGRVRAYYHDHFVRIRVGQLPQGVPEELKSLLSEAESEQADRLCWLRLDFPTAIGAELIQAAVILDNCAPVINRKLEKAIYRLGAELNIKRLDSEGAFLGIEKVESNNGHAYAEVPSAEQVTAVPGTYTVKQGATARFDERDASQLLRHAVDQAREEARAFTSMDVASTVADLRTVEQALSRIERRLREMLAGRVPTYLAMRPFDKSDTAHVHYWTTNSEAALGLPAGTVLRARQQGMAADGNVPLVSSTLGAREARTGKELVQQYRAAVLSRGRIVTRRDIMEHARQVCGARLKDVNVEDGVMLSPEPTKGLVRCLNVVLKFIPGQVTEQEVAYFKERLQAELDTSSSSAVPIRIT